MIIFISEQKKLTSEIAANTYATIFIMRKMIFGLIVPLRHFGKAILKIITEYIMSYKYHTHLLISHSRIISIGTVQETSHMKNICIQ